ncbi:Protein-tyrosine phosphatase [Colletotrichum higginsianum IMI 349063]|uniref:Protein-tyrosine phosphatase n=1 Tax=Colletotrichum higginsianum (strain IMI 349063) TaxID=759273 RepID=A0A1B7YVW9_COLHI|nr:Protein-tyrosine phosphatase [Colletotrichum higginsianum IMI 349063]OBR16187.1 Protein-tyrosine phosphatase [Colletotrichum higginsianum IMI 349063]
MDHLPKFRRKPKIPTISTTDVKTPPSRNGFDEQPPQQIYPSTNNNTNTVTVTGGRSPTPTKPGLRKSAFRGLHLRGSAKRGRSPPAASLPHSPPSPAIVSHDGIASSPASSKQKDKAGSENGNGSGSAGGSASGSKIGSKHGSVASESGKNSHESPWPKPRIPAFLNLSVPGTRSRPPRRRGGARRELIAGLHPDLENKFQDLVWLERERLAAGLASDADETAKWGSYKQTDMRRGLQDRYFNIKPWNHNRIKLRVPAEELDYVNASTISLSSPSNKELPPLRYIAMQGPTENSLDFVWRMVAEQLTSPVVIVQLTSFFENNQVKCFPYLPMDDTQGPWTINELDGWSDGWSATLSFDSLTTLEDGAIEVRKLLFRVGEEEEDRIIWHLLYTKWPDFGVPAVDDLASFFTLMRLSREYNTAPENPRIIHCSAGVGRTGTFITLEHLMRELDDGALDDYDGAGEGDDLIFATVDALREQRRSMVQAESQYLFLYQVLRKLWQEKYDVEDSDGDSEPAAKRLEVEELPT